MLALLIAAIRDNPSVHGRSLESDSESVDSGVRTPRLPYRYSWFLKLYLYQRSHPSKLGLLKLLQPMIRPEVCALRCRTDTVL